MPKLRNSSPKRDPLKALILERMNAKQISTAAFAAQLGMCRQTLSSMLRAHTDEWQLRTIKRMCRALGISAEELRDTIKMI